MIRTPAASIAAGEGPVDDVEVVLNDSDEVGSVSSDGEREDNEVEAKAREEKVKKDKVSREEAKIFDPYAEIEISASARIFVDRIRKNVSTYLCFKIRNDLTFVAIPRFHDQDR